MVDELLIQPLQPPIDPGKIASARREPYPPAATSGTNPATAIFLSHYTRTTAAALRLPSYQSDGGIACRLEG